MILSRITRAIREQNWFAVLLEFVIVIAGVVIGFQVTAWNAERAASETEQIYLARLFDDAERSFCHIGQEERSITNWNERARRTLDALLSNDPEAATDTGFELVAALRVSTGSPYRATLNELVNGGQMNLISNENLRAEIAAADARLASLSEYIQILVTAQTSYSWSVHSRLRPIPGQVYGVVYDFEALADDDEFINALGQALRIQHANISWLGEMVEVVEELRLTIGAEIGRDVSTEPNCSAFEAQ